MNFTVISLGNRKEFQSKYGPMVSYDLSVDTGNGPALDVQMNQKTETPEPHKGQVIWGHIEDTEYGMKLKKDPPPEGVSLAPSSPQTSTQPATKSEETQMMIIRQNALTNAVNRAVALASLLKKDEAIEALKPSNIAMAAYWFAKYSAGEWNPIETKAKRHEADQDDNDQSEDDEPTAYDIAREEFDVLPQEEQ